MITVAKLDERIERCLAILADNPHSQVFAALAEAYRRRGEFGRAFSVCKSGLKHHPEYAPAYIVLAKLYVHQRMLVEAQDAIQKAIDVDGQTRATDMLEAEVYLTSGDLDAARPIIDRLQRSEPRNPAVLELVRNLKAAREQSVARKPADETTERVDRSPDLLFPSSWTAAPLRSRDEPLTWSEWADAVKSMRGVESIFAWNRKTRVVEPLGPETVGETHVTALIDACLEIDAHLKAAGWGALTELRVEAADCSLWCANRDDVMIGLVGNDEIAFGEVRLLAVETLGRVTSGADGGEKTVTQANGDAEGSQNVD